MAQRLYFGSDIPRDWLESTRKLLQAERASGKRTTLILSAGVKTEKQVEVSVRQCLFEIEHDLCVRFPLGWDPAHPADGYDASVLMPIRSSRPKYLWP